jgi:hypothetical protein
MATTHKIFRTGMAATLFLAGMTTIAQGRDSRGQLSIKGNVVCARCSLGEVRNTPADQGQLYQFTREDDRLVLRVQAVNDYPTWRSFFGRPAEIPVRARDAVFQKLMAEENLFKDVEVTGALSTTRALDIFDVTIRG